MILYGNLIFAFNRAVSVTDVIAIDVEAYDLRAAKAISVTDQQDGTVTLISQAERQRCDHVQNVFCQNGLFLHGRTAVYALDTSQNSGDVAVLMIKGKAAFMVMPSKPGEASFYGADGQGRGPVIQRSTVGDVEAKQLRRRGRGSAPLLRHQLEKSAPSAS